MNCVVLKQLEILKNTQSSKAKGQAETAFSKGLMASSGGRWCKDKTPSSVLT
jgi:hypothetical protein